MKTNTVIEGDCLEIMKEIPDKSIDMILCDLPYGTTACKWDTIIPFKPLWEQYKRIIKDNGAIVLTASQPFTSALVMSNPKMFKYEWIWVKNVGIGMAYAKYQPMRKHENILVFCKGKTIYNKQPNYTKSKQVLKNVGKVRKGAGATFHQYGGMLTKDNTFKSVINPTTILDFAIVPRANGTLHPTQKPVALFEYLIKTYTNEGDLVLDNCAGSGTTGVACQNLKRNFILIEKEPEYVAIAENRLRQKPLI